jgi:hypothetical protein
MWFMIPISFNSYFAEPLFRAALLRFATSMLCCTTINNCRIGWIYFSLQNLHRLLVKIFQQISI